MDPIITHALHDEDSGVQWRAVEVLGDIGDPKAFPILQKIIENEHEHSEVRTAADVALNKISTVQGSKFR